MNKSGEFEKFNTAMDMLLRADPRAVKEAMAADMKSQAEERKAKGERKRGKKPKSSSVQKGETR
jgi:hypothetical protein